MSRLYPPPCNILCRNRVYCQLDKHLCTLTEKEEQYTIEAMDYSAIIEMNRRISMQMITPVSTWHYDSHLGNNDGRQDDNIKNMI